MNYYVIIDPVDTTENDGIWVDNVLEYMMMADRVFYVAGTDFEQWFCLKEGQSVQVTEKEL